MLGNDRRQVLPIWELEFSNPASRAHFIATEQAKHNPDFQDRRGVVHGPAKDLPAALVTRIRRMVSTIAETLELDGYARVDFRLSEEGTAYFIEANPNPEIAAGQEFAHAAKHDGLDYPALLNRILALGLRRAGVEVDEK